MNIWIALGVFVILDLSLLTFVIVSKSRKGLSAAEKNRYKRHWEKIKALEIKQAVIEADKLLDELLTKKGYKGSLGDKLKKAGPAFTNVNDVWSAHKLRNRLAHELDVKIGDNEGKAALRSFEKAYRDLGLHL